MEVLGDDVQASCDSYEEEDRGRIGAFIDGDYHVVIDITPVGEDVKVIYDKDHDLY